MKTAKDYYNRVAKGYKDKWLDLEKSQYRSLSHFKRHQILREFYSFMERENGRYAMEIGCGTGLFLNLVTGYFDNIIGMDISYQMLSEGEKGVLRPDNKNIFLVNGDVIDLPFTNNSVDQIFSIEVIRYVRQTKRFLNSVYRVLRPGGKFIFTDANLFSLTLFPLKRVLLQKLHLLGESEMMQYFTVSRIIKHQLEESGFKKISIKFIGLYNNFLISLLNRNNEEKAIRRYAVIAKGLQGVPLLKYLSETLLITCEKPE